MRILIADDSRTSRLRLQGAVSDLGHESQLAEDGQEAWEMVQTEDVDVLITDWLMPRMTGEELCRRVRELSDTDLGGYIYVILLTSLEERAHAIAAMRAGADDFLTKPLDQDDLEVQLLAASRVTQLHRRLLDQKQELKELNSRIHNEARVDSLTSIGNRRRLEEDLAILTARNARSNTQFSVAIFDIDFFKPYNDTYGHPGGDELLQQVTHAFEDQCRGGDSVYRFGGDEIVAIFTDVGVDAAAVAVERMRVAVERLAIPHPANDGPHVTISAGVAGNPHGTVTTAAEILERADAALYRAKKTGRNRVVLAPKQDDTQRRSSVLVVQRSLTQALANKITLEKSGFVVSLVTTPESALEITKSERPDAIVADVSGEEGFEFCRTLRADKGVDDLAILLTTTSPLDEEGLLKAQLSGADGVISKGESQLLPTRLRALIDERRRTDS